MGSGSYPQFPATINREFSSDNREFFWPKNELAKRMKLEAMTEPAEATLLLPRVSAGRRECSWPPADHGRGRERPAVGAGVCGLQRAYFGNPNGKKPLVPAHGSESVV